MKTKHFSTFSFTSNIVEKISLTANDNDNMEDKWAKGKSAYDRINGGILLIYYMCFLLPSHETNILINWRI